MHDPEPTSPLEAALRAAARSYLAARKAAEAARSGRSELLAAMARLSLPPADLDRLRAAASADELPADFRSRLAGSLAREERRLLRLGRAGHPRYDLSRHVALRRALKWLEAGPLETAARRQPSGSELNRRFARRRRPSTRAHSAGDPRPQRLPILAD